MKQKLFFIACIVLVVLFVFWWFLAGCGSSQSGTADLTTTTVSGATTTTTVSGATTTTVSDATTTSTTSTTTTTLASVELSILSRYPTIDATGILSTETIYLQFSKAISYEGMTAANFFTDYATFGGYHNAGDPDLSSASLTWDADSNILYLSGITSWSSFEIFDQSVKVYATPRLGKIKDLAGNSLGTDAVLWQYTLIEVQNPYDGDPIDPAVFTHFVTDEVGDAVHQGMPGDPTFYFDENDITAVSAALVGGRLVVSVEVAGIMNNTQEATTIGTEEVDYRDISIGLDLDNNIATGYSSWGMDIQITIYRALGVYPDCQWGVYEFNEEDTHVIDRFFGQVHAGGQGYRFVTYSAPVSAVDYLGVTIEAGMTYKIMGWSEAETQNGTLDFAVDTISSGGTTKVETVLGGE